MADDNPFDLPKYYKPPRSSQRRPAELLFEFVRKSDRVQFRCELLDHGEYGVEARFTRQGGLLFSRRFDTRALAVQWAEAQRPALEKGVV